MSVHLQFGRARGLRLHAAHWVYRFRLLGPLPGQEYSANPELGPTRGFRRHVLAELRRAERDRQRARLDSLRLPG